MNTSTIIIINWLSGHRLTFGIIILICSIIIAITYIKLNARYMEGCP